MLNACASVNLEGRTILVDPAYQAYNVHHIRYNIMNDSEAIADFRKMRRQATKQEIKIVSEGEHEK